MASLSRDSSPRHVWRKVWLSLLVYAAALGCTRDGTAPIAAVTIFEADGRTCRECGETADVEGMREAIAAGQRVDMVALSAEHLVDPPNAARVRIIIAPEGQPLPAPGEPIQLSRDHEWWQVSSQIHHDEYDLRTSAGPLRYERKVLWYWAHESRSYLTRLDDSGRKLWRRSVPILKIPVLPLTAGRYLVYVSDGLEGTFLVLVDLDSGRLATYPLPVDTRELWPVGVPSVLPYVWDRYVVLPVHEEEPGPGGSAGFAKLRSYVVIELEEGA